MSEQDNAIPALTGTAIDKITTLAQEAYEHTLVAIRPPAEPEDVYYTVNTKTGEISGPIVAQPGVHNPTFESVESLAEWAEGLLTREFSCVQGHYTGNCVSVRAIDNNGRRVVGSMPFTFQEQFTSLRNMSGQHLPHKTFYNTLRTTFRDAVDQDVLRIFRKIDWERNTSASGEVGTGRASMSKAVQEKVSGHAAELPEEILLFLGVIDSSEGRSIREGVTCAIITRGEDQTIALVPTANQLERAKEAAINRLVREFRDTLENAGISVYNSTPE